MKKTFVSILFVLFVSVNASGVYCMKSTGKMPDKKAREEYLQRSSNFDGKKFFNDYTPPVKVTGVSQDPLWASAKKNKPEDKIPFVPFDLKGIKRADKSKVYLTWLGHSSVFMQMSGLNLLFDPIFSKRTSPLSFIGPERYSSLPFNEKKWSEEFPEIDILFISHDHYDHLDYKTIKKIDHKVKKYAVPLGVESHLKYWGVAEEKIINFAWWEQLDFNGMKITAVPSQHFTGRKVIDLYRTLWCGWVLTDDFHNLYISGDSGYSPYYSMIGEKAGPFDFALIECGQYGMGWKKIHNFPEEASQAVLDLRCKTVMPFHWATVDLSDNGWDDSIIRFIRSVDKNIPVATPLIGQTFDIDILKSDERSLVQKDWWTSVK